jgi:hypothetical protein
MLAIAANAMNEPSDGAQQAVNPQKHIHAALIP